MKKTFPWTALWTGTAGFLLAALVGILAGFLFFRLGLFRFLVNLVPDEQPLVRLYTAIVLTFLGVGLAGAVYGVLCGLALYRIDPQGSRRRYLSGGAFAYGVSWAVLLIPLLLLTALFARYNQGSSRDPFSFLALFTLIGTLYGLLSGLILVLITLRVRYIWLPLLSSILGGALGGLLLGYLIWRHDVSMDLPSPRLQLIVFALFVSLALAGLAGGLLGLAYEWVRRRRAQLPEGKIQPGRWQDILIMAAGGLLLINAFMLTNTLVNFVTIHTGTTTTSLGIETQGVGWSPPLPITEDILLQDESAPDLEAGPQGQLAAAWIYDREGLAEVAYAFQEDGEQAAGWSSPVNVSNSADAGSIHPQLGIDRDGSVHILWSEETSPDQWEIRYSRCQGAQCSGPDSLSLADETCGEQPFPGQQDWPAVAVGEDGSLATAWNAGGLLAYTIWRPGEAPASNPARCFQPDQGGDLSLQPRLAPGEAGGFSLVYGTSRAGESAAVRLLEIGQDGTGPEAEIGQGSFPEITRDQGGQLHMAWCGPDGSLQYMASGGPVEVITFPPCMDRPAILQDADGKMHLVWYSEQVEDNFGSQRPGHFIYESVRAEEGWGETAIIAQVFQAAPPAAVSQPSSGLSVVWEDDPEDTPALFLADQQPYHCTPESLNPEGLAVLQVIQGGEFHPAGYQSPFCGNQFKSFIYMPEPDPAFSSEPPTPNGGFDRLKANILNTRYELLISNMMWDPDEDELSPGFQVVEGIAALYKQIQADPSRYPRGLTVRILLGNYPNLATFEYGDQIWNVIGDLRKAGIEQMEDPQVGWKLEVANFRGSYPHSHTKFIVIDGKQLDAAGFNISWLHYPREHPSGKGDDLTDLGMQIEGPVAQPALAVFDDQWQGSSQLVCSDLKLGDESEAWKRSCEWKTGAVSHVPEVLKYYPVDEGHAAFALYRTDVYKEADQAYIHALASAESSIDAIQVNFSADMICLLNLIAPETCTFDNALPWMEALVQSVEQNHVQVRVIVENANMNGLENRVGIEILEDELARRGLGDSVEIRFFDGRVHMKSALVDRQLLFVGSQNFHYSSFSPGGLLEFVAATDDEAAIQPYEEMFEYYWSRAIPADEATWGANSED